VVYRLGPKTWPAWLRGRKALVDNVDLEVCPGREHLDDFGTLFVKVLVKGHRVEHKMVYTWDGKRE